MNCRPTANEYLVLVNILRVDWHLDKLVPVQLLRLPAPDGHRLAVSAQAHAQVSLVKYNHRVQVVAVDLLHQVFNVMKPVMYIPG